VNDSSATARRPRDGSSPSADNDRCLEYGVRGASAIVAMLSITDSSVPSHAVGRRRQPLVRIANLPSRAGSFISRRPGERSRASSVVDSLLAFPLLPRTHTNNKRSIPRAGRRSLRGFAASPGIDDRGGPFVYAANITIVLATSGSAASAHFFGERRTTMLVRATLRGHRLRCARIAPAASSAWANAFSS